MRAQMKLEVKRGILYLSTVVKINLHEPPIIIEWLVYEQAARGS